MRETGKGGEDKDVVVSVDDEAAAHEKTVNFTNSTLDEFSKDGDSKERVNLTGDEKKKKLALAMESMKILSDGSVTGTDRKPDDVSLNEYGEATLKSRLRHLADKMFMLWETNPAAHQLFPSSQSVKMEKQRQKEMNRYLVHPYSMFRCWWDFGVVFVLFVTMIVLPVEVAFYSEDLWDTKWKAFNLIIDVAFMCDILVNFRTGYLEEDVTILNNKKIIIHYLTTWFTTDFISSIPFDYIVLTITNEEGDGNSVLAGTLRALRMVKFISLLRILRFVRLIRYLDKVKEFWHIDAKVLSIFKLITLILGFAHWNACIQYMVAFIQGFPEYSWVVIAELQHANVTVWSRYTHALYRGMSHMISIGYGKTAPHGDHETWLVIISMMMGASFYALFIAHMSAIVMNLDTSGRQFQEKVCEVRDYMKYRRMPSKLQQRVLDYYEYKYQQKYFDEDSILNEKHMSYPLKKEILMHNCRTLVESVPFLSNAPSEFLVDVILKLNMHIFFPGELIVQAGKKGDSMFFIEHGSVNIRLPTGEVVNTLRDGSHFGEISLMFVEKRIADVLAIEMCYIYRLSKADFEEVLCEYPKMRTVMMNVARERMRETQKMLGMDEYIEKIRPIHLVDKTESTPGDPYDQLFKWDPSYPPRKDDSDDDAQEAHIDMENGQNKANKNNNSSNNSNLDMAGVSAPRRPGGMDDPRERHRSADIHTGHDNHHPGRSEVKEISQVSTDLPEGRELSHSQSDISLNAPVRRRHLCSEQSLTDVSM